jgi:hypothetical protein
VTWYFSSPVTLIRWENDWLAEERMRLKPHRRGYSDAKMVKIDVSLSILYRACEERDAFKALQKAKCAEIDAWHLRLEMLKIEIS